MMPKWFESYLQALGPEEKAELGYWILTEPNDNLLTTLIIEAMEVDGHLSQCDCESCLYTARMNGKPDPRPLRG